MTEQLLPKEVYDAFNTIVESGAAASPKAAWTVIRSFFQEDNPHNNDETITGPFWVLFDVIANSKISPTQIDKALGIQS